MRFPLAFLLVVFAAPLLASVGTAGTSTVIMVDVDGTVSQGTALHVRAALAEAEEREVPLLLRLNTPGGLVDATLDMDVELANAEVPVLTFVGPRSGFAASAGTFLFLMGQPNGMAPGTTIGSAQPITIDPAGGSEPASDKVRNFLAGRIEEIAERTGRNGTLARLFVTENLNLDAGEARDAGISDVTADDVRDFLQQIDGMQAQTAEGLFDLTGIGGARVEEYDKPFLAQVVDVIGNPQIAFVLVLAGTYAVIFGLANPGSYVPETIGALLLLLGFIGIGLFSINLAGVLLLVLALLFFVIEVFTPTNGVLTGVGVVALLFAAMFLVDEPLLPAATLRAFVFAGYGMAILSGVIVFAVVLLAMKVRERPTHDSLRGAKGKVVDAPDDEGLYRVEVHGELWAARADSELTVGGKVTVLRTDGLTLVVEPRVPGDPGRQPHP